jgi:Cys-tRNA(Pro)/Cys-tRNA(Cys) deacylase
MDLETYLEKNKIWHRFIEKSETVHTADAAKVAGVPLQRLTKNLISVTDGGKYILLIIAGDKKVNLKAVAKLLNVKKISLVPFEKAESISGCPPGGTPSVGHKTKMKAIIDKQLLENGTIFCGGGSRDRLLELKTEDVIRLNDAIIGEISK